MSQTSDSRLPLDTLAGTIKAHIAAAEKAEGKAEEHYRSAGLHLMEARERVKQVPGLTWPAFLLSQCDVRRRRADELIAIADGRTTLAEQRAATAARVRRHAEKKRALANAGLQLAKPSPRDDVASTDRPASTENRVEWLARMQLEFTKTPSLWVEELFHASNPGKAFKAGLKRELRDLRDVIKSRDVEIAALKRQLVTVPAAIPDFVPDFLTRKVA